MRIGIDGRLIMYRRGMGNYVYHLLHALSSLSHDCAFIVYVDQPEATKALPANSRFRGKLLFPRNYPVAEQVSLPLAAMRDGVDILHCPANTAPFFLASSVKSILTIHDVMYLLPEGILPKSHSAYQRLGRVYRRLVVPAVARRANLIVTVSQNSRRDIVKYLDVDEQSVRVVREASNEACRPIKDPSVLDSVRHRYGVAKPFVFALAGLDPRKNTRRILEAYAQLPKGLSAGYQLLLVGCTPSHQLELRKLAARHGVSEDVLTAGFVPEEDLVGLYNAAQALIYPSLYEGFGLPVLEAMRCGTPVVTSPVGSIPEVAGEAVLWVDPVNTEAISDGIRRVVTDAALVERLRSAGLEQTARFSWRQAAQSMMQIYAEVAGCA